MRYLLLALLPFLITACDMFSYPSPLGRGYDSNDVYHTPAGEKPDGLRYDYTPEINAEIIADWRAAVSDLLNTLESKTQLSHSIYVVPAPRMNALFSTLDHVLREELTARGYELARTPSGGVNLIYDAVSPDGKGLGLLLAEDSDPEEIEVINEDELEEKKFVLSLAYGGTPQEPKATARTIYSVPQSGYYLLEEMFRTSVPVQEKDIRK